MIQRHRRLDQTLIKLPRLAAIVRPQFLPDLMRLKKIALVEVLDPPQIERLVLSSLITIPIVLKPASVGFIIAAVSCSATAGGGVRPYGVHDTKTNQAALIPRPTPPGMNF